MFAAPDSDTAPQDGGGFKAPEDDLEPKSLAGFGHNVVEDVKGNAKGLVDLGQGLMEHPIDTVKNVPGALVNEGKRIGLGELLTGHPINAAGKFVDAAYNKPLSTALDVAPVVGAAGKALGLGGAAAEGAEAASAAGKAAEMAGMAEKAAPAAEALADTAKVADKGLPVMQPGLKTGDPHALFSYNDKFGPGGTERSMYTMFGDPEHPVFKQKAPSGAGGHGSTVPKADIDALGVPVVGREPRTVGKWEPIETNAPPSGTTPPPGETIPPSGGTKPPLTETLANDAVTKAKEVKDYISKGYEGYAKKPGTASEIADYVQEKSQMMASQQMGATPLQARQIGHEGMRALGQYALDNDIVGPTTGLKGMRAKTTALNEAAGKTIGDIRSQADALRVPAEHNVDVLQSVRQKFDPIFSRGTRSGEAGAYAKVLEELEDAKPTFQGMSDLSTKLNKAANEANRLNQPHGVYTDIANEISHINNERIKALVGPEKAATYEQALRDFGATKKIGEFLKRKEAGEVKRMGPGSLTSNLTQKAMDEFGYRAGAKIANKVSSAIKRNPGITKTIPSLFKEFTNQVEDVSHEVTGMSEGGVVPDDVKRYVSKAC